MLSIEIVPGEGVLSTDAWAANVKESAVKAGARVKAENYGISFKFMWRL